ncbi:hypothetical protein E2C01_083733 [Portunus trituberculatus]|uniref:Uncharacterized protein n=1 Tax=Portunus trituberculatus TaxID=210409 RepID=A0A5B7IXX3_PORTR|nr:hypothetical protein [Portunus trituberculatus]
MTHSTEQKLGQLRHSKHFLIPQIIAAWLPLAGTLTNQLRDESDGISQRRPPWHIGTIHALGSDGSPSAWVQIGELNGRTFFKDLFTSDVGNQLSRAGK